MESVDERHALLEWEQEGREEYLKDNPVYRSINYRRFVSYSKGWRNGKRRLREHWKEVRLVGTKRGLSHGKISGGGTASGIAFLSMFMPGKF